MASTTTVLNLEQVRKGKGVSLQQISEATKISPFFLRAIESEEFEKLPGGVFNTNYIRQYAEAISFSKEALLGHYSAIEAARARQQDPPVIPPRRTWSLRWILGWLFGPAAETRS
jgi:cytoskeletal protein RodZ